MFRAAIVLQARMASRRLPGKSLAALGARTILGHCIERLRAESGLPVIVATTCEPLDAAIVKEAEAYGALVVKGPHNDVLSRYVLAASMYHLTHLIRATADNPAVDMNAPMRALALLRQSGADHAMETGLPLGAGVEAMTVTALVSASARTQSPYDREHVTPYLRRAGDGRAVSKAAPAAVRRPTLRLTVDTVDDLAAMRRIHAALGGRPAPAPLEDIIAVADRLLIAKPVPLEASA